MKLKVTKTFAKTLQEELHKRGKKYNVMYIEYDADRYKWNVDVDIWEHESDFDPVTGKIKVLAIDYPAEYYAVPRFLTTKDLRRIYRGRSSQTWKSLFDDITSEIEI